MTTSLAQFTRQPEEVPQEVLENLLESARAEARARDAAVRPASLNELLALEPDDAEDPSPSLKSAVADDLVVTSHDVPIPLNAKVLAYIELFQTRLRDWFSRGLERGTRYLPMIQSVLRAEGLPLDLAYVPLIESAFIPGAVSRAQAGGVWQFMRGTAVEQGLRHDWYVDERADPEKATWAAAKYLKTLHRTFDGDWHLALASYNSGPAKVQRAMKRSRRADFWEIAAKGRRYLPRETREYVPMILAAIVIARNPVRYGLALQPAPPVATDRVRLPGPVDLRVIAQWTGTNVEALQELNPELRRWTTPPHDAEYEIALPAGTGAALEDQLAAMAPVDLSPLDWYVVKKGQTLTSIANRLKVRRSDLAGANFLSIRSRVRPGQKLIVPRAPADPLAALRADREVAGAEAGPAPAADGAGTPEPELRPPAEPTRMVYRVRRGDTLQSIARAFQTSIESIRIWNGLTGSLIRSGDRLTILSPPATAPSVTR